MHLRVYYDIDKKELFVRIPLNVPILHGHIAHVSAWTHLYSSKGYSNCSLWKWLFRHPGNVINVNLVKWLRSIDPRLILHFYCSSLRLSCMLLNRLQPKGVCCGSLIAQNTLNGTPTIFFIFYFFAYNSTQFSITFLLS